METISAIQIARATGGTLLAPWEGAVSAVCTDSRNITPGCLFIPLCGEKFDGHAFIDSALEKGAAGTLCARVPENRRADRFYIQVADTRLALKALAGWYRNQFDIPVVQITGSVGKTTTKDMVAATLSVRYKVLKTPENFNNDIGTPLTLLTLDKSHQAAVIETGMNHFGEIRYLGEMVRPDIAVISNIGDAHIEYLGSREGILQAKCEIFENLKQGGTAVLDGDDALLSTLNLPFETLRCGKSEGCDVRVTEIIDNGVSGLVCRVETRRDAYVLEIPAPGAHMIYSASIAVAIGEKLGLSREEIVRGVASYAPTGSRMRPVHLAEGRTGLDDCYNANTQSVSAALEILAKTGSGRKIAVLGDMGELGELTERAHFNIGSLAAMLGVDMVFAIGQKAQKIADGVSASGGEVLYFPVKEAAMAELEHAFTPDATVLVKASHAMHFETIVSALSEKFVQ